MLTAVFLVLTHRKNYIRSMGNAEYDLVWTDQLSAYITVSSSVIFSSVQVNLTAYNHRWHRPTEESRRIHLVPADHPDTLTDHKFTHILSLPGRRAASESVSEEWEDVRLKTACIIIRIEVSLRKITIK